MAADGGAERRMVDAAWWKQAENDDALPGKAPSIPGQPGTQIEKLRQEIGLQETALEQAMQTLSNTNEASNVRELARQSSRNINTKIEELRQKLNKLKASGQGKS